MAQMKLTLDSIFDPQVKEVHLDEVKDDEAYVDLLVRLSYFLVSKESPLEVQRHGTKMLQHLLRFRSEELSSADLMNSTVELVQSREEDHILSKSASPKEQRRHKRSLLVLAAKNNLRNLFAAEETDFVNEPRNWLQPDGSSPTTTSTSSSSNSNSNSNEQVSSSNTFSESSSSNYSSDELVNYDESEYEIQRLMAIDISDHNELDDDHKSHDDFAIIVHDRMLRFYGKTYGHHVKGCLLLVEHNILCQVFVEIVCLRNPTHQKVVHCILHLLNMIWSKSDWDSTFLRTGFGLSCLICDEDFLEMVCNMVALCEDELKTSIQGRSDNTYLVSLLHLILPFLLLLLRCIHSLWNDQIACHLFEEVEKAKSPINKSLKTTVFLEAIRGHGYHVLGLCMSLEGAFAELLDSSYFVTAFVDFNSMEFRHLRKVILAVLIPLVTHCPKEVWNEWMLEFLAPLLRHCQELLYFAWFNLLHKGRAEVPYYFGKISDNIQELDPDRKKQIQELEYSILLNFTRAVCRLFANMSSLESNTQKSASHQDLEYIYSNSLIGYLLFHDCFWNLRASLFGYWVDGKAALDGIHFCRALVRFAGVTKDKRLKPFIVDELLPSIIKCIDDELPCAFRKLINTRSSSVNDVVGKDLLILCRELHDYLSSNLDVQNQDILKEDNDIDSTGDNFTCWLAKQKKDLLKKAQQHPKEFIGPKEEWNWEFEDEFRRYLPLYIGMLKEVDAIDDSSMVDYSDWKILEKLSPEFKSKYAINSVDHPHFGAILCMGRRKFHPTTYGKNHNKIYEVVCKLISLEPHIKGSDEFYNVIDRLEQNPEIRSTSRRILANAFEVLETLLYVWEPQYHPIIRKEHKDSLVWLIKQLTKGKEFEDFEPLAPHPEDFPLHLKPYAISYFVNGMKTSVYATAEKQLHMHIDFDNHLATGKLDSYILKSLSSEDNLSRIDLSSCEVPYDCFTLDPDLIKLSLQRRANVVRFKNQALVYSDCLRKLLEDDSLKGRLTTLMSELELEGFFNVDSAHVNWEKERFIELVDRFKDEVFVGFSLPRHYAIRGIIDYRTILTQGYTWGAFKEVVGDAQDSLSIYLLEFWRDSRHYKHYLYNIVREPLKIFV